MSLIKIPKIKPNGESGLFSDAALEIAQRHIETATLAQLPSVTKLRELEAEIAEQQAKIDAAKQAELAKLRELETANRKRFDIKKELSTGTHLFSECLGTVTGNTLQTCLSGRHPNPQYAGFWGIIAIAQIEVGAQRVVDVYPAWLEDAAARLSQCEDDMIRLGKELGIVDKLPAELQEKASQ